MKNGKKLYFTYEKRRAARDRIAGINNALEQEKSGIIPRYAFRDYRTGENLTPPGWLVWSTYADGCGVVYRRKDGKLIISIGRQGDFIAI